MKFIISTKPVGESLSERAIPVAVFQTEPAAMRAFIRKWCKDSSITDFDMRSLIDWNYYKERVGSAILKIVTIPAALQGCENPFPKVEYPEWLKKKVKELSSIFKQKKLTDFMKSSDMSNKFTALGGANIEDIGKVKVREFTESEIKAIEAKKEKERKVEEEKKRVQDEIDNPIPIQQDFKEWLRCQKLFWRKYRKQRKEDPLSLMGKSGIISMMKNFDQVFYMNTLQILQIQRTSVPGILRVWVRLANNLMYTLNLEVYRKIYINSKVPQLDATKVNKILPRDRSSRFKNYHLYQIEQKEEIFQSKLDDLMHYHLSNVEIDGVYETQVPLEYRIVLECGNFVRPKVANKHESALNRVYKPQELAPTRCEKPEAFREITKILVYYSSTGNRHFVGMYIPSQKHLMAFAVTQGIAKSSKDLSNVELKFKMTLVSLGEESKVPYDSFEYKHEKELSDAFSKVDAKIKEFKNKHKQAFMVAVHSAASVERLISNGLSSLAGEVPYMTSNGNTEENKYPALDWIHFATTKFCYRCIGLEESYLEKLSFSRYAEIPIGNLHGDTAMQIIDVIYSRSLQKANHLLWYSDTILPDLGGNEDTDFRRFFDQFDSNMEKSFPGFYRTY